MSIFFDQVVAMLLVAIAVCGGIVLTFFAIRFAWDNIQAMDGCGGCLVAVAFIAIDMAFIWFVWAVILAFANQMGFGL